MSYYNKTGHAFTDPDNPRAFGVCDRCGNWWNLHKLKWQMQWNATQLYNTRMRVCPDCLDTPADQLRTIILPADPPPVANPRIEPFKFDQTGPTQATAVSLVTDLSPVPAFYIDLFDADPDQGGVSVLEGLTGSALRTDYLADMGNLSESTGANTVAITFTTQAKSTVNVAWIGIYDAAADGERLISGPLTLPQTVVMYNGLQFPVGALQVRLEAPSWVLRADGVAANFDIDFVNDRAWNNVGLFL